MLETSPPGEGPDLSHVDWTKVAHGCDTVPALLDHCLARWPDRELVVFEDQRITYGDAIGGAGRLAAALMEYGIGRGEHVALLLPNGPEFAMTWFAVTQIGAVAVPISTLASPLELRHILSNCGASLLIGCSTYLGHDLLARIDAALEVDARDTAGRSRHCPFLARLWLWDRSGSPHHDNVGERMEAVSAEAAEWVAVARARVTPGDAVSIIYTSGTTSHAKGVIHSHGTFLRSAQRWGASMDYRCGDRVYNSAPYFWVGGLVTALLVLMEVGATNIGSNRQGAALADHIVAERATLLATSRLASKALEAVPDLYARDWSALRGGSVASLLPEHLRTRNQLYFGNGLGMTETAGPHTLALPDVDDAYRGSMGPPAPGMEHRLVDPATRRDVAPGESGELLVRGDTLMLGYVGRERSETFDPDGWFRTGDLCSCRDGHVFLHGRLDNLVKVAGANVAPGEVEAVLSGQPEIAAAHVAGIEDPVRGQVIAALVVARAGDTIDAAALVARLRGHLAPYKLPRVLVAVEALPMTATSKVDQRRAKAMIAEGQNLLAARA